MGRNKNGYNRAQRYHQQRRKKRRLKSDNLTKQRVDYETSSFTTNSLFRQYYEQQLQQTVEEEQDFNSMMAAFKIQLPATIRVYTHGRYRNKITLYLQSIKEKFNKNPIDLDSGLAQFAGQVIRYSGPEKIGWYPKDIAWKIGTNRIRLRKEQAIKEVHEFLVREARTENITRQEEVSMIPPLLLDVEPHHRVFDACASPGSKTAQLLELLHDTKNADEEPTGFVVANDADPRRAYMLHHQLKRFCSPNLLITCAEAQLFPRFSHLFPEGLFDRILCDVPCSGDGTLRKNADIWRTWDVNNGHSLHPLQVMILWNCVKLLTIGGLIVYSTCTMNPVEDEAVIAQIIRMGKGSLEVVDCSSKLKGLKRRKGLTQWKVAVQVNPCGSKQKQQEKELSTLEEAKEVEVENGTKIDDEDGATPGARLEYFDDLQTFTSFREQHPTRGGSIKFPKKLCGSSFPGPQQELEALGMEKCIRILPHDQDTGGFFVCVIRKTKEVGKWNGSLTCKTETEVETEIETKNSLNEKENENQSEVAPKAVNTSKKEKLAQCKQVSEAIWAEACDEFGMQAADLRDCIYFRPPRFIRKQIEEAKKKEEKPKVLSYITRRLVTMFLRKEVQDRLTIITCGLPILRRVERSQKDWKQGKIFKYRLTNDGLRVTRTMIKTRILKVGLDDMELFCKYSLFEPTTEDGKVGKVFCPGVPISSLSTTTKEFLEATDEEGQPVINQGSYVLTLTEDDQTKFKACFGSELSIAVWKAKKTISQLIAQGELAMLCEHMKASDLLPKSTISDEKLESYYQEMNQIKQNSMANSK